MENESTNLNSLADLHPYLQCLKGTERRLADELAQVRAEIRTVRIRILQIVEKGQGVLPGIDEASRRTDEEN